MQIPDIEIRVKIFAEARQELADRMEALREEQQSAKRRRLTGIRNSLARFTAAHDELHNALADSRAEFVKPKTRILHGIKVGWMKKKGKLKIDDPENVVRLIKKLFADQADTLIQTKERPVAAALQNMSAAELKRLGVAVAEDTDAVLIKPTDDGIDKLIDALINDIEQEAVR